MVFMLRQRVKDLVLRAQNLKYENFTTPKWFGRLRQNIAPKSVPHVQHDYFSPFNQLNHWFVALSLTLPSSNLKLPIMTTNVTQRTCCQVCMSFAFSFLFYTAAEYKTENCFLLNSFFRFSDIFIHPISLFQRQTPPRIRIQLQLPRCPPSKLLKNSSLG